MNNCLPSEYESLKINIEPHFIAQAFLSITPVSSACSMLVEGRKRGKKEAEREGWLMFTLLPKANDIEYNASVYRGANSGPLPGTCCKGSAAKTH